MFTRRLPVLPIAVMVCAFSLGGCAALPMGPPSAMQGAPAHKLGQLTFKYTGAAQKFTVPAGVTEIGVVMLGGNGASSKAATGYGGRVHAELPVKPKEKLVIYVGGDASGSSGGFNGGGKGGGGSSCNVVCGGYGGGGESDIRIGSGRMNERILIAGGGGGEGGSAYAYHGGSGGEGGGLTGGQGGDGQSCGAGSGGAGGTQSTGGAGGLGGSCFVTSGRPGASGGLGSGGAGGGARADSAPAGGGGGGGGGGASYAEASATDVHFWQGWNGTKNGLIVIKW